MVSSVWNLNDDIFTPEEIAAAKDTPANKPSNANHEETVIIGHIMASMVVDANLNPVAVGEQLPDLIHLITKNVIYRTWSDEKYKEMVEDIISSIDKGEKYVSMECGFTDFDYGLMAEDGSVSIIPRNDESSFLSKSLRCYGGEGKYEGYRVGRVLRNITFIGKGYVDNPANPSSVIFSNPSNISLNKIKCGVSILQTSKSLEVEMEIDELKNQVEALNAEKAALADTISKLQAQINDLTNSNASQATELADLKKEQAKVKRVAKLVKGGFEVEAAEAKVDLFVNLDDTLFDTVAQELIEAEAAKKAAKDKEKDMKGMPCSKSTELEIEPEVKTEPAHTAQTVASKVEPEDENLKVVASISDYFKKLYNKESK